MVIRPVSEDCVAVGVPARMVKMEEESTYKYSSRFCLLAPQLFFHFVGGFPFSYEAV